MGAWGTDSEEIRVDSRYNEQRVILASKRVLDAVISPVVFSVAKESAAPDAGHGLPRVIGPRALLLMRIYAPRWIVWSMFFCFIMGTVILSLGPDSYFVSVHGSKVTNV